MKALVLEEDKVLVLREVPVPLRPSSDAVLVKIQASGICGSDLVRGFGDGAHNYPLIMGHEFAGLVEEPSQACGNPAFCTGDLVVVIPLIPCRVCSACQTGDFSQCADYDYLGSRRDGGFAEYVWVPESNLLGAPAHVNALQAAMTEPCAVALHAVSKIDVNADSTAAVIGGGPIGNLAAQCLKIRGCGRIFVTDIDSRKLAIADGMGFAALDAAAGDPVAAIMAETGGQGVDCVVEACGLPQTFVQAIQAAGRFGQVVFMGNIKGDFVLGQSDFSSILRKELEIFGTWNAKVTPRDKNDWTAALNFIGKRLKLEPLISHTPALAEGPEIFAKMVATKEYFGRVIFNLGGVE